MSKKKAGKRNKPAATGRGRGKLLAIIALIAALSMGSVMMAGWPIIGSVMNPAAPQATPPELAKEYIYAGQRLVATEEPQPPAPPPCSGGDDAEFVSQITPPCYRFNALYSVSITMRNTGSTTWTNEAGYRLGSQNPQNNTIWGFSRVLLPHPVPCGTEVTFTFDAERCCGWPDEGEYFNFQWQMVQDGGAGWFGALTQPVAVVVNRKSALGYLDYNNDGITDIATWRSSDVKWRLDYNLDGTADLTKQFYNSGSHIPTPADYDGDGKADLSVFHSATSDRFYIDFDGNGFPEYSWFAPGGANAVPVPGDYDGNGQSDPAAFNKATGSWGFDLDHNQQTDLTTTSARQATSPCPLITTSMERRTLQCTGLQRGNGS